MPELPEVEVTRRGIAEPLARRRACWRCALGKPLRWPLGCAPRVAGRPHASARCSGAASTCGCRCARRARRPRRRPAAAPGHVGLAGAARRTRRPPGAHDHFDLVTDAAARCA
ncbi:MAG: hypothetical protein MZW92_62920 [Comamonadaceae bacterium]|nr:hypothetical protein [Comamonadaceae bacterium]